MISNHTPNVGFLDTAGKYVYICDFDNKSLMVFDDEKSKTIKVDSNNPLNYIKSLDGKELYIYGALKSKGIYKLDIDAPEKPELLVKFPGKEDGIAFGFDIIGDNKILFSGTYDNETGIFLYDVVKESATKLVSGGKTEEGEWCPDYNLSSDKTKLLYDLVSSAPGKSDV